MEEQTELAATAVPQHQSIEDESGGVLSSPMFFLLLGLALFFGFSVAFTYYFFVSYRDVLAREQLSTSFVQELREQRALEAEELSTYGVLDVEQEVIRLPLEAGIEKALTRYKKQ